MKVKILQEGKEFFVDPENIIIKGVTLGSIIDKMIKLEKKVETYQKQYKIKEEKLKKTWDKLRG
jgi:hypothetical protein